AATRGQVIFRNHLIEIIHYAPSRDKVHARPVLIFPPWINKFYILDLQPENSMVGWLRDQGANTFIVSWRSADQTTKDLTWDDYVESGVYAALDVVLTATGQDQVNAVGYCIGGTLLTSALAHMSKHGDNRIASATLLASQADFENAGELKTRLASQPSDYLEQVYEKHNGLMPGEIMLDVFNWLRPTDLVWRYYVDNYLLGKQPEPFDILFWNADQTNIPGPLHRTYMHRIFADNDLSKGRFQLFSETISPSDIEIPVYVQASEADHICPWQSVYKGAQLYTGDVTFTLAGSGHTAGVINPPVAQKYQFWQYGDVQASAEDWRENAVETAGSWWTDWWTWLQPLSGELIAACEPANMGLGPAPGQFVKLKLDAIASGVQPEGPFNS
ncbi:MAG: PHA/PHB synthase family protein, partial [Henriciella sp.]